MLLSLIIQCDIEQQVADSKKNCGMKMDGKLW